MEQRQCRGTGINMTIKAAAEQKVHRTCVVMTAHPTGLCGFCRRTEGLA